MKTKVEAPEGGQSLVVTREFDLPVTLLYRAYVEKEIVEEWMSTRVLKLEIKKHGGWEFETAGPDGQVAFKAHGAFHEIVPRRRIVRTFEMDKAGLGPQLEILNFEELSPDRSRISMQIIFSSSESRAQLLSWPFAGGLNMAHNRLQEVLAKFK